MIVLGIETSCDETGVAIIRDDRTVLSHMLLSQIKDHTVFGGVVPEIAARSHLTHLDTLIKGALAEAGLTFGDLDGVAATAGPGLIGGVMVGLMEAKAIALVHDLPFVGVNHLEAHLLSPRLLQDIAFPYLVLLVSGGHTQLLVAENIGEYRLLATTRDDAVGECFDKAAKILGLPYPGGPNLERAARACTDLAAAQKKFPFAIPLEHAPEIEFSFSGLKTSVRNTADRVIKDGQIHQEDLSGIAASFQSILAKTLSLQTRKAMKKFTEVYKSPAPALIVCGGVAANQTIRAELEQVCAAQGFSFLAPPLEYCTDNGAMVAWAGLELLKAGKTSPLTIPARPRWPLEMLKDQAA